MEILDAKMPENDANAETIREYLKELLHALWEEQEGFSGKRPFGNSGWEYDLYIALINAGIIEGKLDEYGGIESCDEKKGWAMIAKAIEELK